MVTVYNFNKVGTKNIMKVFPNPTTGAITVYLKQNTKDFNIALSDINGKHVYVRDFENNKEE